MLYQLPNGRVVHMTTEEYFNLTDDEIQFLVAFEYGESINDAFHGSVIKKKGEIIEDEPPEKIRELPDVTLLEKYEDQDVPKESD